ncbi:hypothetical protein [Bacillus albus]|uniref:hypothetical protein n=1 Tax=Bacillus albus TaxID=2026189 RepID=UPI00100B70ED|nr:hypothetical protein [Bacillus albus]RXJ33824.1 hypothetical protein ETJ89_30445 [Bacillus albus]WJE67914.1 hypothetical protein QRY64_00030 [Bacillus albus]
MIFYTINNKKFQCKLINRSLLSVSSIRKTTTIAVIFFIALTQTLKNTWLFPSQKGDQPIIKSINVLKGVPPAFWKITSFFILNRCFL